MKNITYLVGKEKLQIAPLQPYSNLVCEYLNELSQHLLSDKVAKSYSDIVSFAFWCRKGSIEKLKKEFLDDRIRMGRGLVFHIAPSNVPINFAFSFAFGLLSGNGNVVRVSTKNFPQINITCDIIKAVLNQEKYALINQQNAIVTYPPDREINDYFSELCDARVIWGGDKTIEEIMKSPVHSRCVEIHFADRVSFGLFRPEAIERLSERELNELAKRFYNDTYLMDQNACSTPHVIFWMVDLHHDKFKIKEIQKRFWEHVYQIAKNKYELADVKVSQKYTLLWEQSIHNTFIKSINRYDNLLYVANIELPQNLDLLRGKFGLFYDCEIEDINSISCIINTKVQTCISLGISKETLTEFILENHLTGIDRIAQIGEALDIGAVWDGYDVVGELSRIISF